jgi:hypothetical protein
VRPEGLSQWKIPVHDLITLPAGLHNSESGECHIAGKLIAADYRLDSGSGGDPVSIAFAALFKNPLSEQHLILKFQKITIKNEWYFKKSHRPHSEPH